MTVRVAVFDVGGVLCRWVPERRLAGLAALTGLGEDEVERRVFASGWEDGAEAGRVDLAAAVDHLTAVLDLPAEPATADRLRAAWAAAFEPDLAVLALVARCTVRTALFTNNGPLFEAALAHELAAVRAPFDEAVLSWRLRVTKPDPSAFAAADVRLGTVPADVLFVDDSAANVAAARDHGWAAHQVGGAADVEAVLTAAGVLNSPA